MKRQIKKMHIATVVSLLDILSTYSLQLYKYIFTYRHHFQKTSCPCLIFPL